MKVFLSILDFNFLNRIYRDCFTNGRYKPGLNARYQTICYIDPVEIKYGPFIIIVCKTNF
jgi:hypothetical protein